MALEDPNLIVAIAAFVAAIAALIFAVVQTVAALSQYVQVSSRCSPRVTGVFNLTAGFWFHVSSLSWNPQYRMPVLTLPGLRGGHSSSSLSAASASDGAMEMPMMEEGQEGKWANFAPGKNFDKDVNGYKDYGKVRVARATDKQLLKARRRVSWIPTIVLGVGAAIWTPIGLVLSAIAMCFCFPPAFCCGCVCSGGCGGEAEDAGDIAAEIAGGLMTPLTFAWKHAIRYKAVGAPQTISNAPGLESAAWCQFLINYQDAWWGHANVRWEWRLATMIPVDVYGATIETSMADLRLLAALGGMQASTEPGVLARARCGEMLTTSQHLILGRIAYYRSGRENIRPSITMDVPDKTSRYLQCIMAVQNHLHKRSARLAPIDGATLPSVVSSRKAIANLLSRPRTEFDAQIDVSLGHYANILSTPTFQSLAYALHSSAPQISTNSKQRPSGPAWTSEEVSLFLGPLGAGICGCSCLACFREWQSREEQKDRTVKMRLLIGDLSPGGRSVRLDLPDFWPALGLQAEWEVDVTTPAATGDRPATPQKKMVKIVGPFANAVYGGDGKSGHYQGSLSDAVVIETLRVCHGGCNDLARCVCGRIARVVSPTPNEQPSREAVFAVAAINTKWLGKCSAKLMGEAAESLAEWVTQADQDGKWVTGMVEKSISAAWKGEETANIFSFADEGNVDLVRIVMAATEVYLLAVRKTIGTNSIWEGPATAAFDDFGPVVLGA
ncbi:uncharacterized protein C8A04DRAFT_14241 [Dichotomopilus funicola]|uniref:Uncharacterized protein n=1 Tax=Dichotomopilus funicola TaxID=1934379 RepID=A0AAN6UXX8_9PEZI|nr:hypothetical protein C8A04DRAFT_14241 [Dichotomopilus funicola]